MQNTSSKPVVALIQSKPFYPDNNIPDKLYPEFQNLNLHEEFNPNNHIFSSLRELFSTLRMDEGNIGKSSWNPLSEIINPGDTILIKPNLVKHKSQKKESSFIELITHPSLIVGIIDYVILALKGKGTIIIGDAPIQEADFEEIMNYLNLDHFIKHYEKITDIKFEIVDFRKEMAINKIHREIQRLDLKGDPRGYSRIDLKQKSALSEIAYQYQKFRVTNYDKQEMLKFHNKENHSYLIANSALKSDVIISLPKLKSHRKAGITCSLKNLVGINGSKDCLPHHRKGSTDENGDEYLHKSFRKRLLSNLEEKRAQSKSRIYCFFLFLRKLLLYALERIFPYKDPYKEGSWYGNDTIPRTIVDLIYILYFSNKDGTLTDSNKNRKLFTVTDAIICGEGEGPLNSQRKEVGFILASQDLIANDIVASYLAGFDPVKIPTIIHSLNSPINYNNINMPEKVQIISNKHEFQDIEKLNIHNKNKFVPSMGWKNHIEL